MPPASPPGPTPPNPRSSSSSLVFIAIGLIVVVALVAGAVALVATRHSSATTTSTTPEAPLAIGQDMRSTVPKGCKISGSGVNYLPDRTCTPGTLNPAVTQATISTTICISGYSSSVRPPASFTSPIKKRQMKAWGITGDLSTIEEDHLVPISLGGAPSDSSNLWPQPGGAPNTKDTLESKIRRLVCKGTVPLAEAQTAIATDWQAAYRRWVGPLPSTDPKGNFSGTE